ncbi:hypothetical protein AB0F77_41155 [Streptomyces sp. NPDC026672]|uniref:hypothetical protein n=1 Tax=unclassified Streptomyces TaxID=2593676 RepID=UPI003406AC4C
MNQDQLLRAAGRALGRGPDDREVRDALVAAGVVAAAPVSGGHGPDLAGLLRPRAGEYGAAGAVLVPWTDPSDLLERDPAAMPRLAAEWAAACAGTPGVRLSVGWPWGTYPALAALLREGHHVVAVSRTAPPTPSACPAWDWPLPVTLLPDATPEERLRLARRTAARTPLWRECVTETVPDGRWARAGLVVCSADTPARPARTPADPTATVAVALVRPGRTPDGDDAPLSRIAARHGTTNAALVDPGADTAVWLAALLSALARDAPLDVALDRAATAVGAARPLLYADPGLLDTTRISAVIARTTAGTPAGPSTGGRTVPDPGPHPDAPVGTAEDVARRWARLLREIHHDRRRRPHRVLRARLTAPGEETGARGVRPHTDHDLTVWVGRPGRDTAARTPLPTDTFTPGRTVRLRITAAQLHGTPPPRTGQYADVDLPSVGRSEEAGFTVRAGAPGSEFRVRVTVFHRHRFLQSGVLSATVGSGHPPVFELDAVVRADTEDLAARVPHDAALAVGPDAGGGTLLTTVTSDAVEIRAPAGLSDTVGALTAALRDPAERPERYGDYTSPAYTELLTALALSGSALFRGLFGERIGLVPPASARALRRAGNISVLAARPGDLLPLELVYDKPLNIGGPLGTAGRLCPDAPALTGPEDCAARCPGHSSDSTICPFGFWGASKVIERHVHADRSAELAKDFALAAGPVAERATVDLGATLLTAACDRADHNTERAWTSAVRLLDARDEPATTWRELALRAQRLRDRGDAPGVLLLVVHSERVTDGPARGTTCLVIGRDDRLSLQETLDPLLTGPAEPNPLVLLLGCRTADHRTPLLGAQLRLLEAGAPGVVGTLAPVLARHIVPVAVELMSEIRHLAARSGAGLLLGEALTRARRTALLRGEASALALVGYGDTDWEVHAADPTGGREREGGR